jgi:hypothetical protein
MTTPEGPDLSELVEKVEGATEGSARLDHLIEDHFSQWVNLGGWRRRHKVTGAEERFTYCPAPPFTTSVDAALALVGERLPEWQRALGEHTAPGGRGVQWRAALLPPALGGPAVAVWGATAPVALCLALLRALQSPEASTGAR